ncbi:MAG: NAD(P)-binding domain-containing protein [Acidobacteriota bacterium]
MPTTPSLESPDVPATVAILGAGRMARAVAGAAIRAGQRVVFGSRRPEAGRAAALAAGPRASAGTLREALAESDFVVLALRWQGLFEALAATQGLWNGKTAVDLTNPATPDGTRLLIGLETSGAEEIARRAPEAEWVKALNHVYAEVLERGSEFGGPERPAAFYAGDSETAKRRAATWLSSLGFAPVDAGPLSSARWLEPVAQLMVELVEQRGFDAGDTALALLRRGTGRSG